jgi:ribosomal protein L37E
MKLVKVTDIKKRVPCREKEYSVRERCVNCGMNFFLIIPKGSLVYDHIHTKEANKIKCEHCGCNPFNNGFSICSPM